MSRSKLFGELMKKTTFAQSIRAGSVITAMLLYPILGCTDLTEVPQSSITPENFYRNEDEVIGGLASVYAQLRSTTDDYYNVSEVSTDEIVVPTRGQDWYDNGQWLDIHRHTWNANSPGVLALANGAWVNLFGGVARANVVINALDNVNFASKPVVLAELRTLRAYYYFLLMDMFGGVPIVTDLEIKPRAQNTRAEVFKFIEDELKATHDALPKTWPPDMNGRITQGASDAILASLYLNAEVFTGTVTTAGLQKGTQQLAAGKAHDCRRGDRGVQGGQHQLAALGRAHRGVLEVVVDNRGGTAQRDSIREAGCLLHFAIAPARGMGAFLRIVA